MSHFSSTSISCRNWSPNYSVLVLHQIADVRDLVCDSVSVLQLRRNRACTKSHAPNRTPNRMLRVIGSNSVSVMQWGRKRPWVEDISNDFAPILVSEVQHVMTIVFAERPRKVAKFVNCFVILLLSNTTHK
jgi:hypothetical protein